MKRAKLQNHSFEKNTFENFVSLLRLNGVSSRDGTKTILKPHYLMTELFWFDTCTYIFCNMTRNHATLQLCPFHLPRLNFVIFYHYLPQISNRSTWLLKIWSLQHFFQYFTYSASVIQFNILLIFSSNSTNLITKLPEKF